MNTAQWIWCDAAGVSRNAFALFRHELVVEAVPASAVIHLFADARYRCRVNGVVVAYGPGRFIPSHPESDAVELAPHLRRGRNIILVEAWSPDCSTFQTAPESAPGFIAWGSVHPGKAAVDFATPGQWRCQRSTAWAVDAPAFSFAQGPVEILDAAQLPDVDNGSAWHAPVACIRKPWGAVAPRSLPLLGLHLTDLPFPELVAELAADEIRLSCRVAVDLAARRAAVPGPQRFPYSLVIDSPRDQVVDLGMFWGPHFMNGVELKAQRDPLCGNRENFRANLRRGANLLYGEPESLTDVWAQYVAVPRSAGVTLGALRHGPVFAAAELARGRGAVPLGAADLDAMAKKLEFSWQDAAAPTSAVGAGAIPSRDVAWDRPAKILAPALTSEKGLPLTLNAEPGAAGWVLVSDSGGEFLGHLIVALEAPAGTVIDIAVDERRRADGLFALYGSSPFVDGVDRFISSFGSQGGRQEFELFHPRGGRFVQMTIRPPSGGGTVVLHRFAMRDHQVAIKRDGAFACGDADFTWTWEASYRTLQACVEDAFLDCPWRERGTYLGDALVETATLAAFSRDLSVAKRSLRIWAQGQLADGMMSACAPSWLRKPHEDFSLIWVLLLHDLWTRDGDLADARAWWPAVARVLESPVWKPGRDGLWNLGEGTNQFIDWGVDGPDRRGDGNACINAFRYRAYVCAAQLAGALGRKDEAAAYAAQAETVGGAFRARLWIADQKRFARAEVASQPDRGGDAMHANALALAFGLADAGQAPGVLHHVERCLHGNAERLIQGKGRSVGLELYFLAYALEGLYRHGRAGLAEQVMREHWSACRRGGAWTIWETLGSGAQGQGSLCHAWSTTPVRWFHERVLGVRREQPGDPRRLVVAPDSMLDWAEGTVPHPLGTVRVAWKRHADHLDIHVTAPDHVSVTIEPGASFTGLRVISQSPAKADRPKVVAREQR